MKDALDILRRIYEITEETFRNDLRDAATGRVPSRGVGAAPSDEARKGGVAARRG